MAEKIIIKCAVATYGAHNTFLQIFTSDKQLDNWFSACVENGRLKLPGVPDNTTEWRLMFFTVYGAMWCFEYHPTCYTDILLAHPNIIFEQDKKTKQRILDKMPPDGYYVVGSEEGWEDGCFFFNEEEAKEYAQQYCIDCDDNSYLYTLSHPKKCVPHVSFEWEEI